MPNDYTDADIERRRPTDYDDDTWRIENDGDATWALRTLAAHQAELDRLNALAAEEAARIKAWRDDATAGALRGVERMRSYLTGYFIRLRDADDSTPRTYRLPAGKIGARKQQDTVELTDEAAFIQWCIGNDRLDLLRIVPAVADIKKAVVPNREPTDTDTTSLDLTVELAKKPKPGPYRLTAAATGEVLPGITYVVGSDTYYATPED